MNGGIRNLQRAAPPSPFLFDPARSSWSKFSLVPGTGLSLLGMLPKSWHLSILKQQEKGNNGAHSLGKASCHLQRSGGTVWSHWKELDRSTHHSPGHSWEWGSVKPWAGAYGQGHGGLAHCHLEIQGLSKAAKSHSISVLWAWDVGIQEAVLF